VQPRRPRVTLIYTVVYVTGKTNFELDCEGANILPGPGLVASVPGGGAYGLFEINGNSTDFRVHGFLFSGNYRLASAQDTAFAIFGAQRFSFYHLDFSGDWGNFSNPFVGDWQTDGVYRDIKMANVGICFDFGYNHHLVFDKIFAHGSDGASGPGKRCFSVLTDVPNNGTNPTPVTITDTDGYTVTNSDISNFAGGFGYGPVVLVGGRNLKFHHNYWHDNPGVFGGTTFGSVATIFYSNGGTYSSVGTPVNNVVFDGNIFDKNGGTGGLPVIAVNGTPITNSDRIGGIVISNNVFTRNTLGSSYSAISTDSATGMAAQAYAGGNNYFDIANYPQWIDLVTIGLGLLPGHREMFNGNTGNYVAAGATAYAWTGAGNSTTENNVKSLAASFPNFVRNLYVFSTTIPAAGQSYTITLRKDSANTSLTCTITVGNSTCVDSNVLHAVGLGATSGIDLALTSTAGAAPTTLFWSVESDSYN
jgi:hypothetical protein